MNAEDCVAVSRRKAPLIILVPIMGGQGGGARARRISASHQVWRGLSLGQSSGGEDG